MATNRAQPTDRARLLGFSFALFFGALLSIPLLWATVTISIGITAPFVVFMAPVCLLLILPWTRGAGKAAIRGLSVVPSPVVVGLMSAVRWFNNLHRKAAGRILGAEVPRPYLVPPRPGPPARFRTLVRDAATWRDLTWLLLDSTAGIGLCVPTFGMFAVALWYFIVPMLERIVPGIDTVPMFVAKHIIGLPATAPSSAAVSVGIGLLVLALWWALAPTLMRGYGHLARALLGPTQHARLVLRVAQLAESRADTVDSQAAEIRRIERDLHDGAQARLVALGMNLGMAEELLNRDPGAARELITEARQSTNKALAELRGLVRGIHPPVLADRGLTGAVHALALDSPLTVDVDIHLPGRPIAPVESAAYFAVAETLTNAAKHGQTSSAWVRIEYENGKLVVVVGDRGKGGAVVGAGGGLHGIRRRLAAFDGTLTLTSPKGGPTVIVMEVPCALSAAAQVE